MTETTRRADGWTRCVDTTGLRRCSRKALYFGRWAGGGLCLEHALKAGREHGFDAFHEGNRAELEKANAAT